VKARRDRIDGELIFQGEEEREFHEEVARRCLSRNGSHRTLSQTLERVLSEKPLRIPSCIVQVD
jgi:hypothetical protein